eukprot:GFYU01001117.1.p1 GENE.GFYU01001117.1~~GFYU01001117.1.p1  ORF type:complete len:417 (-),score=72.52 GFYU01001117.1:178-1398(-)
MLRTATGRVTWPAFSTAQGVTHGVGGRSIVSLLWANVNSTRSLSTVRRRACNTMRCKTACNHSTWVSMTAVRVTRVVQPSTYTGTVNAHTVTARTYSTNARAGSTQYISGYNGLNLAFSELLPECTGSDVPKSPVILLHGGGQTRHSWTGAMNMLAKHGHHVKSFDLRGHGDSDWAEDGDYSTEAYIGDLEAAIDSMGGTKPVVVGASLGGIITLVTTGNAIPKDVVKGLVLVDVTPTLAMSGVDRIIGFMKAHPGGFASVEEAGQAVIQYMKQGGTKVRSSSKKGSETGGMNGLKRNLRYRDGRYYWHWDPRFLEAPEMTQFQDEQLQGKETRLVIEAKRVKSPTLLIHGSNSDVVTEEQVKDFQRLMPHAEYFNVTDATHMVVGDANDPFIDAIVEFIDRLDTL